MQLTVADVMITAPKVIDSDATVGDLRSFFDDEHVHMALLVKDSVLRGTVLRADLPVPGVEDGPALNVSQLRGRIIAGDASAGNALTGMVASGERRLVVVDREGRLKGLLCLKRRLNGFCSDSDQTQIRE
jgi:CBS domain-containing protein